MIKKILATCFFVIAQISFANAGIPWEHWEHQNDFSDKDLSHYSKTHIYTCKFNCKKNYAAYEFYTESDGNVFLALRSRQGQFAKFNDQKKVIKDRIELGPKWKYSDFDMQGEEFWFGFKAKLPKGTKSLNAEEIMFSQFKQIQKDASKEDCHFQPSMKIKIRRNLTGYFQINGSSKGEKIKQSKGEIQVNGQQRILNNSWRTFMIGTKFDNHQNGWMEIYVDGKLVQNFVGDTLYNTKPTHCKRPLKKTNYVFRIGVYRGTYKNNLPANYDKTYDEIHFDDFVSGKTKVFVENFLNN